MENRYIGLTIGPLYKTITSVKHTRELWGASYIFSYIMKKMIEKLKNNGKKFIIPYTQDDEIFKPGREVGLFHDRFIFKAEKGDFEKVEVIKNEVLQEVAENINRSQKDDVYDFLQKYFQIYFCEMEIEGDYKTVNETINLYLDSLELQSKFVKENKKNYLFDLFDKINSSFLIEDAFGRKRRHSFLSIAEIAGLKETGELDWTGIELPSKKDKESIVDDTDIYDKLEEQNKKTFRQYHKYIAIVQADGDNLGATINSLNNNDDFAKLSKALLSFSNKAHNKIKSFGGITIFAGGDDLLFFAPIISAKKSVFELVYELGEIFEKTFEEFDKKPTLSTGISITYYKYPMGEALENAAYLLFKKAKNFQNKNAIAFQVQKHSGKKFTGIFNKNTDLYSKFQELIQCDSNEEMLTSIIHKLFLHQAVIQSIGTNKEQINNYFENFFNEPVHQNFKQLMESVAQLIHSVYSGSGDYNEKTQLIDSVLRLKKFIGGERCQTIS